MSTVHPATMEHSRHICVLWLPWRSWRSWRSFRLLVCSTVLNFVTGAHAYHSFFWFWPCFYPCPIIGLLSNVFTCLLLAINLFVYFYPPVSVFHCEVLSLSLPWFDSCLLFIYLFLKLWLSITLVCCFLPADYDNDTWIALNVSTFICVLQWL